MTQRTSSLGVELWINLLRRHIARDAVGGDDDDDNYHIFNYI